MENNNYYEILQVNQNASNEIINKSYKTLIKKYHPDLYPDSEKEKYEELVKKINEAYEVLIDEEKRKEYDILLNKDTISFNEYNQIINENESLKEKLNNISQKNNGTNSQNNIDNEFYNKQVLEYKEKLNQAVNQAYHDAYIQDLKNRGYKIKYKKTFKEHFKNFFSILIFIFILIILYQIPFIKNILISIYNDNEIIQIIVDFIVSFFVTIKNTFLSN